MTRNTEGVKFRIEHVDNETIVATLIDSANNSSSPRAHSSLGHLLHDRQEYDDEGALYYVVVVVFIYGFSIILMIGSLVRKNQKDSGINNYMKDMDKVRQIERRQQKFKTRLMMQKTRIKGVLGQSRSFGEQHSGCSKEVKPKLDTKVWLASLRQDSRTSVWSSDSGREDVQEQLSPLLLPPAGPDPARQVAFPSPTAHEIPQLRIEGVAQPPGFFLQYAGPRSCGSQDPDPERDRLLMYLDADDVVSQSSSSVGVGTLHPLPEEEEEEDDGCYGDESRVPMGDDQHASDCSDYTVYMGDDYV